MIERGRPEGYIAEQVRSFTQQFEILEAAGVMRLMPVFSRLVRTHSEIAQHTIVVSGEGERLEAALMDHDLRAATFMREQQVKEADKGRYPKDRLTIEFRYNVPKRESEGRDTYQAVRFQANPATKSITLAHDVVQGRRRMLYSYDLEIKDWAPDIASVPRDPEQLPIARIVKQIIR